MFLIIDNQVLIRFYNLLHLTYSLTSPFLPMSGFVHRGRNVREGLFQRTE